MQRERIVGGGRPGALRDRQIASDGANNEMRLKPDRVSPAFELATTADLAVDLPLYSAQHRSGKTILPLVPSRKKAR